MTDLPACSDNGGGSTATPSPAATPSSTPQSERPIDETPPSETPVARGAWQKLAPVPTPRSEVAVTELNGRIYVIGGFEQTFSDPQTTLFVYDPATDSWETQPPLPTARHGMGAATVDGTVYVPSGGPTPGLSATGANEAFTPRRLMGNAEHSKPCPCQASAAAPLER